MTRVAATRTLENALRKLGFYRVCGAAMVGCIAWAGSALFTGAPIFWPEALALEFFAVSWLVKGRADRTAVVVGRRTLARVRDTVRPRGAR